MRDGRTDAKNDDRRSRGYKLQLLKYSMRSQRNPVKLLSGLRSLTKPNFEALHAFEREKSAQGMAPSTRYIYIYCLNKLARFFKKRNFKDLTKDDMIDFLNENADYKSRSLKVSIKAFYKWLFGENNYPEQVSWIKTHGFERRKLPEDILTKDDVRKLADVCDNPRDRALIMLLYESGCRAGELLDLEIRNLTFDDYGASLILDGKTGMRRVRLIDSVPDLRIWLNHHPQADNPQAHLFTVARNDGALDSNVTLRNILIKAKNRAKLKKRIYPHLFRHSRATHLATDFTEQELKIIFGWTGGSKMPATYVHLSGADIDKKMLEKRGLLKRDVMTSEPLQPRTCPSCEKMNPISAKFCVECGMALEMKAAIQLEKKRREADSFMSAVMEDPKFRKMLAEKAMEMGLERKLEV